MVTVALVAYVAATAVGMVVGSLAPFWYAILPLCVVAGFVGGVWPVRIKVASITPESVKSALEVAQSKRSAIAAGATWGALAGSFAASTCSVSHAHTLFGSDVAAVVVGLVAIALVIVADMLPRAVATRPHALCGLLFLSTVGLALALGAEMPAWPH